MNSTLLYFYSILARGLPPTKLFAVKRWLLRLAGAEIGMSVRCVSSASFFLNGRLSIGKDTWVGHEVLIVGGDAPVVIGKNCDIAPRVLFATGAHKINYEGDRVAGEGFSMPITIDDGCWICAGAIILGGTSIGQCCIVAAGAVVKGDFPPRSLIGGVPARVIREFTDNEPPITPSGYSV